MLSLARPSTTTEIPPDLIIMEEKLLDGSGFDLAPIFLNRFPNLAMIFLADRHSEELAVKALRLGFSDYISPPLRPNDVLEAANRAIQRRRRLMDWSQLEARRNTKTLQKRVDGLEALQRVGRSVTAVLDLDNVLTVVVDAAVELTGGQPAPARPVQRRTLYAGSSQFPG